MPGSHPHSQEEVIVLGVGLKTDGDACKALANSLLTKQGESIARNDVIEESKYERAWKEIPYRGLCWVSSRVDLLHVIGMSVFTLSYTLFAPLPTVSLLSLTVEHFLPLLIATPKLALRDSRFQPRKSD